MKIRDTDNSPCVRSTTAIPVPAEHTNGKEFSETATKGEKSGTAESGLMEELCLDAVKLCSCHGMAEGSCVQPTAAVYTVDLFKYGESVSLLSDSGVTMSSLNIY